MPSYTVNNQNQATAQSLSTAYKSVIIVTSPATVRRVWFTECEWGATDVPNATDCPILFDISKQTVIGTATAVVPILTDSGSADAAALANYTAAASAEGTITANSSVFFKSINQRASDKQWWRDKASCPIIAAVSATGFACRAKSPNYASTFGLQISVEE